MADAAPPLAATGWSSSLSVAEMAAIHEAGFVARGLVMGSSVYRIGISYSPMMVGPGVGYAGSNWGGGYGQQAGGMYGQSAWGPGRSFPGWSKYYSAWGGGGAPWGGAPGLGSIGIGAGAGYGAACWERITFEQGMETAAGLALQRLTAETAALGAHGVIGTRLQFRWLEGLVSTVEFTAIGTAVARPGSAPLPQVFTSHLDGQSLLKLLRAGLVPAQLAVGAGSVAAEVPSLVVSGTAEIVPYGEAVEASRRIAAERLSRNVGAGWAVVGTDAGFAMESSERGRTMTTVLTGTAVVRFAKGHWDRLPLPIMRLSRP